MSTLTSINAGPDCIMARINESPVASRSATFPSISSDPSSIILPSPTHPVKNSAYMLSCLGSFKTTTTALAVEASRTGFNVCLCFLLLLDDLVALIRTKDSLNIHINGHADWAFYDSGGTDNVMSESKAKEHDLAIEPHAPGRSVDIDIYGGKMQSIGSVTVCTGIVGEPKTNCVLKFLVATHCVKPLTMGMPFLDATKSLRKEHFHRRKAPPLMSGLMPLMAIASSLSFLLIVTFSLWTINVFMSTTEQSEAKLQRLAIELIKDTARKAVHAIPDTGSGINCMPKAIADEMGYHIKSHWWNRKWIRNAAGHLFLTEGTVEEKIRIGEFDEDHEVLFHVVKEIDVHIVGRDFVDHHGVFEDKYSSAMIHDTKPKVHELFQLYKDHGLTAWIRHGWRKLVGRQNKENKAIQDQNNEQMKRISEEDKKRAESKRLAAVNPPATKPPLIAEASGGLQIDSLPTPAIEDSNNTSTSYPELTGPDEEYTHNTSRSNQVSSLPVIYPCGADIVSANNTSTPNLERTQSTPATVPGMNANTVLTSDAPLENSVSLPDPIDTTQVMINTNEVPPPARNDQHTQETQNLMLSPAGAALIPVDGINSEAPVMDTPKKELQTIHPSGDNELEASSSPTVIINGDVPAVPDLERLDPADGSSKAPSSDGFHDSTHHTPRRSGSFVKENGNSLEYVSIPSPLHTSIPLVPDNSPNGKALGSSL